MHGRTIKLRDSLLGKEFLTNHSGRCVVIEFKNSNDVTVMFTSPKYIMKCSAYNLRKGKVRNPYSPTFHGNGFIGVGKYTTSDSSFEVWRAMLNRCYSKKFKENFKTYKYATVCDEWLNFQNFAEWCYSQKFFNVKDDKGRSYELDKDLLRKCNKTYSPDTSCFVPRDVNILLTKRDKMRGEQPIGVTFLKRDSKYKSRLSYFGKGVNLGTFDTAEEAFKAYKKAKESYIKEVADIWKERIDERVCQALLNYEVHIDD